MNARRRMALARGVAAVAAAAAIAIVPAAVFGYHREIYALTAVMSGCCVVLGVLAYIEATGAFND